MAEVYFISHPEVRMDTDVLVTKWGLSEKGKSRLAKMLDLPWVKKLQAVYASTETKAMEAAAVLAQKLGLEVQTRENLGEMDRSATGFLKPEEFNMVVDEFFTKPDESIRGWERAMDAQVRIVTAVEEVLKETGDINVAILAHGGVGALLLAHLKNVPISKNEDQPGQGHYFVFDAVTRKLIQDWKPIDEI